MMMSVILSTWREWVDIAARGLDSETSTDWCGRESTQCRSIPLNPDSYAPAAVVVVVVVVNASEWDLPRLSPKRRQR